MRQVKAKSLLAVCFMLTLAMALIVLVPIARSGGPELAGTFKGTGSISYVSPCNGATISGTVNVSAVVNVFGGDSGQPQVFVSVTYNAPNQKGTDGNTYNAHGAAFATYDTLAPIVPATGSGYYDLPMNLDYDNTTNQSLSFLAGTHAFVDVNSKQNPTNVPDVGVEATCGE
jgi:hypothetical protein